MISTIKSGNTANRGRCINCNVVEQRTGNEVTAHLSLLYAFVDIKHSY